MHEEAFAILKKFGLNLSAINILIEKINDIERANEFAIECNESEVWSALGKAQLEQNSPKEAIESFIKSKDSSVRKEVFEKASEVCSWSYTIYAVI